jgi:hypothetical protein
MKPHQKILLVSALGVALAFFIVLKYGFRVRAMVPNVSDDVFGTMAALSLFAIAFGFARMAVGRKVWDMGTVVRSVPGPNRDLEREKAVADCGTAGRSGEAQIRGAGREGTAVVRRTDCLSRGSE